MNIHWQIKEFEQLSSKEVYEILRVREEVFVIEQECNYTDVDGKDLQSWHLMCWCENQLAAYARILPAGLSFVEPSIGRVLTSGKFRGLNLGRELLHRAIEFCNEQFNSAPIRIGAQTYLIRFYNEFGFIEQGESYDDAGIEHIDMLLTPSMD